MKIEELPAEMRQECGSAAARRLRGQGKVPAVLYGHGLDVVALTLSREALDGLLRTGQHLVTLRFGDRRERALVKEIQFDPWGKEVLHVDFSRVGLDELVTVAVEIVPHGVPKAVLSGWVLEQTLHRVDVSCKANAIPEQIVVEVGQLEAGGKIHVKDLPMPEGVKALADPETIVFILKETRELIPSAAPTPETAPTEPEVIGRAAKAEEEAEEEQKEEDKEKA